MGKPERSADAEAFYNAEEAQKYNESSSLNNIQGRLTQRCLELLGSPAGALVLDIGCGSCISTQHIAAAGNLVVGVDISSEMLRLGRARMAAASPPPEGAGPGLCDLLRADIGAGLPLRSAAFGYAVSVSALQWIVIQGDYRRRLDVFFATLYDALASDGVAVLQYFPETDRHMDEVMRYAKKNGFRGGTLIDNPESRKKKKVYLMLEVSAPGPGRLRSSPALRAVRAHGPRDGAAARTARAKNRDLAARDWILRKKEKRERQGHAVPATSKYTGRARRR